ncbi:MAG: aryl-sulfate sulfotransferase N-terminal domain-containing protein, partial [Fusobacteriaceae bacterium]
MKNKQKILIILVIICTLFRGEIKKSYKQVINFKNILIQRMNNNKQIELDISVENKIQKEYTNLYYNFENPYININPYGRNPMSALIKFETEEPSKIKFILKDKYSSKDDYIEIFDEFKIQHDIPVKYLYADTDNRIQLISEDEKGIIQKKDIIIKTENLKSEYPVIISKNINEFREFILLEYGSYGEKGKKPVIIDSFGNIRG